MQQRAMYLTNLRSATLQQGALLLESTTDRYLCRFVASGAVVDVTGKAADLYISEDAVRALASSGLLLGAPMFAAHDDELTSADMVAVVQTAELAVLEDGRVAVEGEIVFLETDLGRRQRQLADALLAAAAAGAALPAAGVSLSVTATIGVDATFGRVLRSFDAVRSVDFVTRPAAGGRVLARLEAQEMNEPEVEVDDALQLAAQEAVNGALADVRAAAARQVIEASDLPEPVKLRLAAARYESPQAVAAAIVAARRELDGWREAAEATVQLAARPARGSSRVEVLGREREIASAVDWAFGVRDAALPNVHLRSLRNLYVAATGDGEWTGRYDFAAASTSNLSGLAADAMNKVIIQQYNSLMHYRWYEQVTAVQPNDGSLQQMQWIEYGGVGTLPTVAEGAAYTELTMADTQETSSFVKYGGYIGVTEEMFRNSQLAQLRAVPLQLANAAVMTRSAKIAALFTMNSNVGPTLAQDGTALFHSNHGNLHTGALSLAAWSAARLLMAKQAQLGNTNRLMAWPRLLLVPVDLYDSALVLFGYGSGAGGYPGTANNDVNPFAMNRPNDPRPSIIPVPEWTDTNNWAWLADPALLPVIQISYDGGDSMTHRAPEVLSVTDPRAGLVFTNDVMPFKVKDRYAYGVAGYRGIGKSNVAGG